MRRLATPPPARPPQPARASMSPYTSPSINETEEVREQVEHKTRPSPVQPSPAQPQRSQILFPASSARGSIRGQASQPSNRPTIQPPHDTQKQTSTSIFHALVPIHARQIPIPSFPHAFILQHRARADPPLVQGPMTEPRRSPRQTQKIEPMSEPMSELTGKDQAPRLLTRPLSVETKAELC